jgi:hypothetical protein
MRFFDLQAGKGRALRLEGETLTFRRRDHYLSEKRGWTDLGLYDAWHGVWIFGGEHDAGLTDMCIGLERCFSSLQIALLTCS